MIDRIIYPTQQFVVVDEQGEAYLSALRERLLDLAREHEIPTATARGGGSCATGYWRGYKFCLHTIVKLKALAAYSAALYVKPIQGSYSTSTSASAGTHGGGGAGDIAHGSFTESQDNWLMNVARDRAFLIYWDRDAISGLWSDHGHFIDPSCPNLSAEAAAQVVDFYYNRNGLANNGPDFGSRASVSRLWSMYQNRSRTTVASVEALFPSLFGTTTIVKDWFDMATKADLIAALKDPTVLDAIAKRVWDEMILHPTYPNPGGKPPIQARSSLWSANRYAWLGYDAEADTQAMISELDGVTTPDPQ